MLVMYMLSEMLHGNTHVRYALWKASSFMCLRWCDCIECVHLYPIRMSYAISITEVCDQWGAAAPSMLEDAIFVQKHMNHPLARLACRPRYLVGCFEHCKLVRTQSTIGPVLVYVRCISSYPSWWHRLSNFPFFTFYLGGSFAQLNVSCLLAVTLIWKGRYMIIIYCNSISKAHGFPFLYAILN